MKELEKGGKVLKGRVLKKGDRGERGMIEDRLLKIE